MNSDHYASPGIVSLLFQCAGGFLPEPHIQAIIAFSKLLMVSKTKGHVTSQVLYLCVPGITNAVNWYLIASTYTNWIIQCSIFDALIGAHVC